MATASAFVDASLATGFSLPTLEAMLLGRRCCSRDTPVFARSVVMRRTTSPPHDPADDRAGMADLAATTSRCAADLRRRTGARGAASPGRRSPSARSRRSRRPSPAASAGEARAPQDARSDRLSSVSGACGRGGRSPRAPGSGGCRRTGRRRGSCRPQAGNPARSPSRCAMTGIAGEVAGDDRPGLDARRGRRPRTTSRRRPASGLSSTIEKPNQLLSRSRAECARCRGRRSSSWK